MGFNESDFMRRALELARRGLGHTRPNPPVGAVIACNGRIVGEGWHRRAGSDHAEVAAIKDARRRLGPSGAAGIPKDSTIYVTLEPCSRPGRVGACTDAIVAAGIRRVVYAVPDPNPKNRGRARRVLARHGVSCECWAAGRSAASVREGDEQLRRRECVAAARRLVTPFAKHVATGLPYVVVKVAMSLDGRICDDHGDAKWISSGASRRVTGLMRSEVDAIMVGAETVRRDDPSLLCHQKRNDDLVRVVVSRSGRLPKNAQVFTDGAPNPTLVFDDARKALSELGKRGVTSVLCEGGLALARSLADQGLVDEWHAVLAPAVIGSKPVADAMRLRLVRHAATDSAAGDVAFVCSRNGTSFL